MDARAHRERSAFAVIGIVIAVTVATYVACDLVLAQFRINTLIDLSLESAALSLSSASLLWFAVLQPLRRDAARERAATLIREGQLQAQADRQEFDGRMHRALEMAATEEGAYEAVRRAMDRGTARLASELLLADSSDAHLKRAVTGGSDVPGCAVESPRGCPAIRRSQTLQFASGEDIDACPHLSDRLQGDRAATCVPVSVAGRSIGVLHSTSDPSAPATTDEVTRLETIATQAGSRIGLLRVMESTHLQAATDPLTGLLNRRSLENQVQDLLRRRTPMAVAMADLDHFKQVNDTHGHDAGDRALRLFARLLRSSLRSEDLVSRYGGEEFVVAFPGLSADSAAKALARVQEELLVALAAGNVPPYTASFGVSHTDHADSLEELCRSADNALFRAKSAGRNRIIIDSSHEPASPLA